MGIKTEGKNENGQTRGKDTLRQPCVQLDLT